MKANISPRDFGDLFYAAVIRRVGTETWLPLAAVPETLQLAILGEISDTDTDSGEWEYFGARFEFRSNF